MTKTNERKVQHIRIIHEDQDVDRRKFYFDQIRLRHRALPEINLDDVDTSVVFMGKKLSVPLLISCMTGGDHNVVRKINQNLAKAAEETQIAMGVGSQRVMFTNPKARSSFDLRKCAQKTLLFANLGAIQLNNAYSLSHCKEAVDVLDADALCLHLNPLQESIQPEGDTNFSKLSSKIKSVAQNLKKPVILKEVGAGISKEDVKLALKCGIRYIDVAGSGGTSWSRIEHHRHLEDSKNNMGLVFQDWGIPTPLALQELKPYRDRIKLIASGGIRSGIDIAKASILGASLCGVASPFLKPAMTSEKAVIEVIEKLKKEFKTAMFLLGMINVKQLWGNESLIMPSSCVVE